MQKVLRRGDYEIKFNKNFTGVIRGCREIKRPGQEGTWITDDIISAYTELHRLHYALSAESYLDGTLVGGCYGVLLGNFFCGESMFSNAANASKAAFLGLAQFLFSGNKIAFIDCQVPTDHLRSFGGEELSRKEFLKLLKRNL